MATEEGSSVSRKVYFFRLEHFDEVKRFLPGAFERIANLPFNDQGRYQKDVVTDTRLCAFPDRLEYPIRVRLGRTRRDLLPEIEREGHLKTLELQENEGLIDVCHVVIFDDGHVAAEFNHDGPRLIKLGMYLFEKGGSLPTAPRFLPLFERDIVEVVSAIDNIKVVEITVPPSSADLLREADDNLASAVEASARIGANKKVSLTLTGDMGTTRLKWLAEKLAKLVKAHARDREQFSSIRATGYMGGSAIPRFIDILEDKLVSGEIFPRTSARSRSIDSDRAYQLIEQAYASKRGKLSEAATATELW